MPASSNSSAILNVIRDISRTGASCNSPKELIERMLMLFCREVPCQTALYVFRNDGITKIYLYVAGSESMLYLQPPAPDLLDERLSYALEKQYLSLSHGDITALFGIPGDSGIVFANRMNETELCACALIEPETYNDAVHTEWSTVRRVFIGLLEGIYQRAERELPYKAIIDNIDSFICIVDKEGRIVSSNRAYGRQYTIFHRRPVQLGQPFHGFFTDPNDATDTRSTEWQHRIELALRGEQHRYADVYRTKRADFHFETRLFRIDNDSGQTTGVTIIAYNVTEQKRYEARLKADEAKFKAINDLAPHGLFVTDTEGSCIYINTAFSKITGLSQREALGHGWAKVFPELNSDVLTERYQGASFDRDFIYEEEVRAVHALTGKPIQLLANVGPMSIENEMTGFVGSIVDITERKRAEERLDLERERLELALSGSAIGLWDWDIEHNKFFINDQWGYIHGYDPDGIDDPRKVWQDVIHPDDHELVRDNLRANLSKHPNRRRVIRYRAIRKDGTQILIEARGRVVKRTNDDQPLRLIGTVKDVTDQERRNELLKAKELAEKTAKFKDSFLANMSHEIRTPLNGIIGMIDVLATSALSDRQKEYVEILKTASDNLLSIINDILFLSKLQAGKLEVRPVNFPVQSLARLTKGLFEPSAKQKKLKLSYRIENDVPDYVKADKTRLTQIISNLVSNAIKFTDEGSITVIFSRANDTHLKISVQDTGVGISEANRDKLFLKFSQLDSTITKAHKGTGLGLAICRELTELMDGTIAVESAPDEGSTFSFTFRFEQTSARPLDDAVSEADTHEQGKLNLKILLVEDQTTNQRVMGLMLSQFGCQFTIARNGLEAIEVYETAEFDLILMDVQMPVMDGVTATNHLKAKHSDLPPVIGVTANAMEGDETRFKEAGMDDYLAKPVRKQQLEDMLRKWNALING